jgi:hypothetical protein
MDFKKQASRPLEAAFSLFTGGGRRNRVSPTATIGAPGTAIYGGYVVENETEAALSDRERYKTFSRALANTSIVAAGTRYFLNLAAGAKWTFEAADHPRGKEIAEMVEKMLTEDPRTSWPRIVRRAAMYRFYGFSIQEWTARRNSDGLFTFADVAPRAQITIERWDVAEDGRVLGVVQRNPQFQQELYLPRSKIVYLVDDSLNDSPQGLGLFRHIVEPVRRLNRYEQLEGFGLESDLRGVPIGRAPYSELQQRVASGEITEQQARQSVAPIENFVKKHIKTPELGILLDSQTQTTEDEAQRPSGTPKFDVSLLEGSQTSLPEVATAIERINREIARVLGVEAILLGDGSAGSYALARDKTSQFSLTVDATLQELVDGFKKDLVETLFRLNGWPIEAMPNIQVEAVQYRSTEEIAGTIRDLATAGAVLEPDDPIINFIRGELGAPPVEEEGMMMDASLMGVRRDNPVNDGESVPDREEVDE